MKETEANEMKMTEYRQDARAAIESGLTKD